jgi:hypothetical protein
VTQIRETGGGFLGCVATWTSGPKCLKTFTYATGNGTGGGDEEPSEATGFDDQASKGEDTRGLEKQLQAHEQRLEDYKRDPDQFDNKGFLRDAQSPEQRQKIIDSRIRNLERQIANYLTTD